MKHLFDTANDMIELTGTIEEGLKHIASKMDEGHLRETLYLYEDILEAFASIEVPIQPLLTEDGEEGLASANLNLKQGMELLARAYEANELEKAKNELQNSLLPAFGKWKTELESSLKKYKDS